MTYNDAFKRDWVDELAPKFHSQNFEVLDENDVVIGTVVMPAASLFNAATGAGVATLQTTFDVEITTAVGDPATKFRAYIGVGKYQEGTIGTSGADLNVASVNLNNGDKIRVQTWTLTFPV